MSGPRERRPKPEPRSPEEEAEIEAKYQELYEFVERMRMDFEEEEARRGAPLTGRCQAGA